MCPSTGELVGQQEKELFIAIDNILGQYNNAGFTIKTIHADREFKPLFEQDCAYSGEDSSGY